MKCIILVVTIVLVFAQVGYSQLSCAPPGFNYEIGTSICFGYAQARAFGCATDEARYVNVSTVSFAYFNRVSKIDSELKGIMVGDIVIWSNNGQINPTHGHAAYVSEVNTTNPPFGKFRTGVNGQVSDENLAVSPSSVYLDHVPGAGEGYVLGVSFSLVHASRLMDGDIFMGVYRLKTPAETPTPATYQVTFKNSFTGGQINVGKKDNEFVNRTSPDVSYHAYNAQIPAQAIDSQVVSGSKRIFSNLWKENGDDYSSNKAITVTVPKEAMIYEAQFSSVSSTSFVEFENRALSTHIGGLITVSGIDRKSRTDQYSLGTLATAYQSLQIDRVQYTFYRWEKDGVSYSTNLTIAPSSAGLYVAVYTFNYILPPDETFPYNNPVGQPIKITWKKHTSSFVDQIQVWRKVKNVHSAMIIATLSGGATEVIDYDYSLTSGYTDDLIDYDVRPRYSLNGTYSSPDWLTVFGEGGLTERNPDDGPTLIAISSTGTEFEAFPNPFNPSTTFSYTLEKESLVEITVFNLTGQVVGRLSNDVRPSGPHHLQWNAGTVSGVLLPSGTYFVRFAAYPVDGSGGTSYYKRLLLVK